MVYVPAAARAPLPLVPFQMNEVSPVAWGITLKEVTGRAVSSLIVTVSFDVPAGASPRRRSRQWR